MRYFFIVPILVMAALTVSAAPSAADTRYVGDQMVITLRQGQSTEYKILKTLKTGTAVEVLAESDNYLKVRTADGTVGYVLRQYISQDPPKALRINELESRNSELLEKIRSLEKTKNNLQGQLEEAQGKYVREFSDVTKKSTTLEQSLEQALENERTATEKYNSLAAESENVIQTVEERDILRQENSKLRTDMQELRARNEELSDTRMIKWFLAGGGVLFFGWLIGRISRKKRHRY